jgi:hypothetical protein
MYLLHLFKYTNKDRYVYYHCIRKNAYNADYHCQPYDDPLTIPMPDPGKEPIESIIFPVRRILPLFYHPRIIRRELQERIRVHVTQMDS